MPSSAAVVPAVDAIVAVTPNPARSLGPAIASGIGWSDIGIYVGAPVMGAALAMVTYEFLRAGRLGIASKEPLGALGRIDALEASK